ncbi:hypothetical protein FE257_002236 [Aspergillus nanangensis]|uniref:Uncharacterized protein n=1 Tax=Aspergillus nanangensis TaxID=2582783 RepID=A0AAD4CE52_ASPNN|nr:hypothetical protein FE257_002236 [Aspergillus nanangensis]
MLYFLPQIAPSSLQHLPHHPLQTKNYTTGYHLSNGVLRLSQVPIKLMEPQAFLNSILSIGPYRTLCSSWSTGHADYREHQKGSSAISHIIRNRFSNEASTRNSFKLTSKSPKPVQSLVSAPDIEGSLMSEKGYDSDAHFLTTPKQTIDRTAKQPLSQSSIWGRESPVEQSLHESEWELPLEHPYGTLGQDSRVFGPIESGRLYMTPQAQHDPLFQRTNNELTYIEHGFGQPNHASSCLQGPDPRDPIAAVHAAEEPRFHRNLSTSTGSTNGDDQYYEASGHAHISSGHTLTPPLSNDPLIGPYSQLSVKKRRQNPPAQRREEVHSIHLGDINIPKLLALSSPSSSRATSQVQPLGDRAGRASASDQYDDLKDWGNIRPSGEVAPQQDKGVPSSYSRTSLMSGPHKYRFESRVFNHLYRKSSMEHPSTQALIDLNKSRPYDTQTAVTNFVPPATDSASDALEPARTNICLSPGMIDQSNELDGNFASSRKVWIICSMYLRGKSTQNDGHFREAGHYAEHEAYGLEDELEQRSCVGAHSKSLIGEDEEESTMFLDETYDIQISNSAETGSDQGNPKHMSGTSSNTKAGEWVEAYHDYMKTHSIFD